MPISSTDISGLIGGQTAMFSNNLAFSQQLSGAYGTGPMMGGGGGGGAMQNPFPSVSGSGIVGGAAMALPAAGFAASLAGGIKGGMAGWLDPFTGVGRAFAAGAGAPGAGFGGTMGHIGRQFAAGGARGAVGGMGAIGGGLAAGLATGGLYMAAGSMISGAAESIYEGAQVVGDVERVAQRHMAPAYGTPGVRPGGQMARSRIQGMVDVLHELASENVMASVGDMTRLLDKFASAGMLTGVQDPGSFKRKFSSMIKQVDSIAKILGTSLDEAAPLLQSMQQMGMWRAEDIMGTTMAMRQVGPGAAPHMMAAMQTGAQRAHAMGGTMAGGAALARQQFLQVQAAGQSGLLPNEAIMEFTGGIGGAAGQRMVAEQMTGTMQNFVQHPMGRLMMAGLGEYQGGRFTGRVDEELMNRFQQGQVDVGELQRIGMSRTQTRQGAASFTFRQGQIGQEVMAQGGMEGMVEAINRVMERAGYADAPEEIRGIFIQQLTGVNQRMAEMIMRMGDDLPRLREIQRQKALDTINDSFQQLDRRMNHSVQGLKDAIKYRTQEFWRPFQEFGGRLSTQVGEGIDQLMASITGYQRPMRLTEEQRIGMLAQGKFGAATYEGLGIQQEAFRQEGPLEVLRREGLVGRGYAAERGLRGEMLEQLGAQTTTGAGVDLYERGGTRVPFYSAVAGNVGAETVRGERASVELAARRARARGQSRSIQSLGFDPDNAETKVQLSKIKSEMNQLMFDPAAAKRLRNLKEQHKGNPAAYQRAVLEELKGRSGQAKDAINILTGKLATGEGQRAIRELDVLAAADTMAGGTPMDLSLEWEKTGEMMGGMPREPAKLNEMANQNINDMISIMRESNQSAAGTVAAGIGGAVGGVLGGLVGSIAGPGGTAVGLGLGALGGAKLGRYVSGAITDEATDEELRQGFLNAEWGQDLAKYIQAGGEGFMEDNKFLEATKNDPNAAKIKEYLDNVKTKDPKGFAKMVAKSNAFDLTKYAKLTEETRKERKNIAEREMGTLSEMQAKLDPEKFSQYKEIIEMYASGDVNQQKEAAERSVRMAQSLGEKDIKQLGRGGAWARQIAALGKVGRLGAMTPEQWKKQQLELTRSFGFDVQRALEQSEFGGEFQDMLGGGIQQGEVGRLKEMLTTVGARVGARPGKGEAASQQEKLVQLMTTYAGAHQKFVHTVAASISKIDKVDLDAAIKKVQEMQSNPTASPTAAES